MKKTALVILLILALFRVNLAFKPKKRPSKYITIEGDVIKANTAFMKLPKEQKDSILLNLKF